MSSTLAYIIAANVASTVLSIGLAAWLSFRWLTALVDRLVCVSAGLLLTVAFTDLLPEAFHSEADPHALGWLLVGGILGFFLLEKLALIHHTHHHEGDAHGHAAGHDAREARRGGWPVLIGDAFHNFADGVMIAAAFVVDVQLGLAATLAVIAHEIPHEVGDFMILLNAGFSRRRAFVFNLLSGAAAVVGGLTGYFVLDALQALLPYALALAAASFIYIALSDLLPEMMRRASLRRSAPEVVLVLAGVLIAALLTGLAH
ncbi:MAG: ZIP family metal transporter [Sutterellaceae bacterium]|nr:ZIP family metal transporter [Burkholderiaceae bacterium]MDW8430229.1 ZIP family metal transporter [Sutterellaceae bacterium]